MLDLLAGVGEFIFVWGLTVLWLVYVVGTVRDFLTIPFELWGKREKRQRGWTLGLWGIVVVVVQFWWWWT